MTRLPPARTDNQQWVRREPLAGDAATRRYFRLTDRHGATAILAKYPAHAVATSAVGRKLAEELQREFLDSDAGP